MARRSGWRRGDPGYNWAEDVKEGSWTADTIFDTEDGRHPDSMQVQYVLVRKKETGLVAMYFVHKYDTDGVTVLEPQHGTDGFRIVLLDEKHEVMKVGDYSTIFDMWRGYNPLDPGGDE